jgi:hypothetical protein
MLGVTSEDALQTEVRDHVGRTIGPWTHEVTTTGVRAFARGAGYDDPRYYADGAIPAPPCFLGTPVYRPGASDETFSGPRGTGYRPRFGMTRSLDAGTEITYERPLRAGDVLQVTDRVVAAEVKHGRTLGTMVVVTSEVEARDADGALVATERTTIIFH